MDLEVLMHTRWKCCHEMGQTFKFVPWTWARICPENCGQSSCVF